MLINICLNLIFLKNLVKPLHLSLYFVIFSLFVYFFKEFILFFFYNLFSFFTFNFLDADSRFKFDSNMISDDDLFYGFYRALSVDRNVVLPYFCFIRFLITSLDVLHSWAIPSLGIKLDACPGRLAQTMVFIKREGFFYGQCSEICGINHAFMPIVIEAVDMESYFDWLENPTPSVNYF